MPMYWKLKHASEADCKRTVSGKAEVTESIEAYRVLKTVLEE